MAKMKLAYAAAGAQGGEEGDDLEEPNDAAPKRQSLSSSSSSSSSAAVKAQTSTGSSSSTATGTKRKAASSSSSTQGKDKAVKQATPQSKPIDSFFSPKTDK